MPPILVTGATGTVGGQVAEELLKAGAQVCLGIRTPQKAQDLAAKGAKVVAFDRVNNGASHGVLTPVVSRCFGCN